MDKFCEVCGIKMKDGWCPKWMPNPPKPKKKENR